MKLVWSTDPHLDHLKKLNLDLFIEEVAAHEPDALLLTGDIAEGPTVTAYLAYVYDKLRRPIYFVLGNHDFYRSSIATVEANVRRMRAAVPELAYLPDGVQELTADTCLVGVNGWADGLAGNPIGSRIAMCDWDLISELKPFSHPAKRHELLATLEGLSQTDANLAQVRLAEAASKFKKIIFACHVPPWPDAAWHQGKRSDNDWLPWFCSVRLGQAISGFDAPEITVLCGHSHSSGEVQIAANIKCLTGSAAYGSPGKHLRVLEV